MNVMKLIKIIAVATLLASTSIVSAKAPAAVNAELSPNVARACTDWPYCREIEVADQSLNAARACTDWPYCREIEVVDQSLNVARACTDWPYCREIEITEQSMGIQQQMQTEVARKAV
jgi:hypothetical protein